MKIDLNCDLGESFGRYQLGQDEAILPHITSANIACGFHAGDPGVMAKTVALAAHYEVEVGAHPGYPDLQGFGRRAMALAPGEVEALIVYQVGALAGFARAAHTELTHVKPHGALYNQAVADPALAAAIARGVAQFSRNLILVGLAGSPLITAGEEAGLRIANEAFPDRAYNPDGTLRSRQLPGAVFEQPEAVAANAVQLAQNGIMFGEARVRVDTLCIHGDNVNALPLVRAVRAALAAKNIEVVGLRKL